MNRILVPVDGSPLSEAILPVAEALARDYGAELLLLRAVRPGAGPGSAVLGSAVDPVAEAANYLKRIAETLRAGGLARVRWDVRQAAEEQAITTAATRERVDLIAMTTHGRGGIARLLLGSVAERVIRRAPAPVLLIRGQLSLSPGKMTKILVPLDGSKLSAEILPIVERLAGPFDLTIALLHAVEPVRPSAAAEVSPWLDEMTGFQETEAEAYLSKVASPLEEKGLRVRQAVRVGQAAEVIQQYAREERIGMIAMSTHGRTGLGRVFFGSVAERVLRGATVPVLLWKAREE